MIYPTIGTFDGPVGMPIGGIVVEFAFAAIHGKSKMNRLLCQTTFSINTLER